MFFKDENGVVIYLTAIMHQFFLVESNSEITVRVGRGDECREQSERKNFWFSHLKLGVNYLPPN